MTAAEVKNAVALLGFNPELSDEEEHARFWSVLNAVIPTVAQFAPEERVLMLAHSPLAPSYIAPSVIEKPYRESVSVTVPNAAAIYFEVTGTGRATLTLGAHTHDIAWSGAATPRVYQLIVSKILFGEGEVSVKFKGDARYQVLNLCAYEQLASENEADILPPSDVVRYDMDELVEDFDGFSPLPVRRVRGMGLPDARWRLCGRSGIELSRERSALLDIVYYHRPAKVSEDNENVELDIEPTLHHLVPLLVAHYLWMDDEPTKAAQYKANYDEQLALWRMRAQPARQPHVINATGW